jgi:hypothetical protein
MMTIRYQTTLDNVEWYEIKAKVQADEFDNGRTTKQLKESFENSQAICIAYDGEAIIGKSRALSDGVCNGYVVDVWTYTPYHHRSIASQIMEILFAQRPGQHIYLFTDEETLPFYDQLGMKPQGIGVSKVIGEWLVNEPGR